MRNREPQSISNLFNTYSLVSIQEKSIALSTLNHLIYQFLPNTLHQHCRVANYRQGILVIEVSSANWLTRLRYEQEKLLLTLRQNGLTSLASLQYKINPALCNPTPGQGKYIRQSSNENTSPQRQITPKSASLLLTLAQNTTPKLKTSLIKLANHVTKIDNSAE